MIRTTMFCLLAAGTITIAGCGHPQAVTRSDPRVGRLVGRDELLSTGQPWLLDALRVARPTYFASRGPISLVEREMPPMIVVIEGLVIADLEPLRMTRVSDVAQVRRLTVAEAFFKYNRSVSVGGLEIVLRK